MKLGGRVAAFMAAAMGLGMTADAKAEDISEYKTSYKPSSSAVGSFAIGPQRYSPAEWLARGEPARAGKAEIQRRRNGGR